MHLPLLLILGAVAAYIAYLVVIDAVRDARTARDLKAGRETDLTGLHVRDRRIDAPAISRAESGLMTRHGISPDRGPRASVSPGPGSDGRGFI